MLSLSRYHTFLEARNFAFGYLPATQFVQQQAAPRQLFCFHTRFIHVKWIDEYSAMHAVSIICDLPQSLLPQHCSVRNSFCVRSENADKLASHTIIFVYRVRDSCFKFKEKFENLKELWNLNEQYVFQNEIKFCGIQALNSWTWKISNTAKYMIHDVMIWNVEWFDGRVTFK